jgi:hypothetical protein
MPRDAVRLLRVPRRSLVVALAKRGLPFLKRRAEVVGFSVGAYLVAKLSNTDQRAYPIRFLTGSSRAQNGRFLNSSMVMAGITTERF